MRCVVAARFTSEGAEGADDALPETGDDAGDADGRRADVRNAG
jgi:hypothetical protein